MDEQEINRLRKGDILDATTILEIWFQRNIDTMSFPELDHNELRVQGWAALFEYLGNPSASAIHYLCLKNVRILSRDKTNIDNIVTEKWINILLELSGLYQLTAIDTARSSTDQNPTDEVKIEALKCLCNLVFNSPAVQELCSSNCLIEGVVARCKTYKDREIPHEIKYYDMRLLFIITALRPEKRESVKKDFHGLVYLVEFLDEIVKGLTPYEPNCLADQACSVEGDHQTVINDKDLDLACEILKTLFNLVLQAPTESPAEAEEAPLLRLVAICHTLLLCGASNKDKEHVLHNNVVNFLTSVPSSCYSELAPLQLDGANNEFDFEGRNMKAVRSLIEFLQYKISITQNVTGQYENLSPILGVLHRAASSAACLRKFLRAEILPPLTDARRRPEEGGAPRNQLCRLLTSPVTHVRDLTAQFLFILCKESVSRMVKYTGYGNAAGLFATRGLLGPSGRTPSSAYSSDSEDSDTDEYRAVRHAVNPVTGRWEPPRPDPMAGCTDEQKEYEAMKLVNLMDQLSRAGIVQPCRVGPDGRPEPVQHVLQLQEELPAQQLHNQ